MEKTFSQNEDAELDFVHFWPGQTCGCPPSTDAGTTTVVVGGSRHWSTTAREAGGVGVMGIRQPDGLRCWSATPRSSRGDSTSRRDDERGVGEGGRESVHMESVQYGDLVRPKSPVSQATLVVPLLALLVLWTAPVAVAFNVDLRTATVHVGPPDSMFGYAVAQHIDQSTNWVLIGAPRTQTSQPRVFRGGAVFRCKTDRPRSCQEVPFDETGNNIRYVPGRNTHVPVEDKSNQWFGSTLQSSGKNGVIVACAPRYVYFSETLDKREPIGMCYVARSTTVNYERFSPCRQGRRGFNFQGYCQAGFSAALAKDGSRLLIGAPGSWYWQGQLYNYDTSDSRTILSETPEGQPQEDDTYMGQLFQVSSRGGRTLRQSEEGPTTDDYGYMGYASAVGEFDGDDTNEEYVVGIPKGANSTGMIEIFAQNMTVIGSLEGEQIGSYFGSALAVLDVTANGRDDIVVGAPFFGNVKSDDYESGRVYIYYQTERRKFKKHKRDILNGFTSQSRFGMALGRLGDINHDSFDDLCVGAPYAGEDRRGAIYIYHGSSQGIITDPSQIIYAKDVNTGLSAFGISVSGGLDQDSNAYPDLLVGAYASDNAVFFRTRPVVKMTASIIVDPPKIDLTKQRCGNLNSDERGPCLNIVTCLGFSGKSVPHLLYFDVTLTLDAKENGTGPSEQRSFFTNTITDTFSMKNTMRVSKDQNCSEVFAYVKGDLVDKLTPIKILLEFELNEERFRAGGGGDLVPILDARIPTWTSYTVEIKNDCGDDNICYPDLYVTGIRVTSTHIIGTTGDLEFVIIVYNNKEDSYNTKVWVTLPPGVVYDTVHPKRYETPISCGTLESDSKTVVCDIGNPMKGKTEAEFQMNVTPTNTNDTKDSLVFVLFANSSNIEERVEDYNDNHDSVVIPVTAVAEISLRAKVNPEYIVLNTTKRQTISEERLVTHVFQLRNQGTCATNETILQVLWPSHDEEGNFLLTLNELPIVEGNGKCNVTKITTDNAALFKDRWWIQGFGDAGRNDGKKDSRGKRTAGKRIDCSQTGDYCTVIQCHIGYMAPYSIFEISMLSNFRPLRFLKRRDRTFMYEITSVASARVLSVPYDFKAVDTSKFATVTEDAVTVVHTDKLKPAGKGVKIWIIALAITAGVLLLILLILLLWFCGFFKRKKHDGGYLMVKNGQSSYIDSKIVD